MGSYSFKALGRDHSTDTFHLGSQLGRLSFAGEATDEIWYGTAVGGWDSGDRAAREALETLEADAALPDPVLPTETPPALPTEMAEGEGELTVTQLETETDESVVGDIVDPTQGDSTTTPPGLPVETTVKSDSLALPESAASDATPESVVFTDENEYEVNNTDGNLDENEAVAEPAETTAMDVASVDPEDSSMTSSASVDRAPLCPLAIALYFAIVSPW